MQNIESLNANPKEVKTKKVLVNSPLQGARKGSDDGLQ